MPTNRKPVTRGGQDSGKVPVQSVTGSAGARIQEILHNKANVVESLDRRSGPSSCAPDKAQSVADIGPMKSLTVLVADNHPVVREGLVALINRQPDMRVIAEASNGRQAVEAFFAQRPDIALLDLRMPIMDGIDAVISICEKDPRGRIAIITSYQDEEDIYRALRAGAQGYILKDALVNELVECIHAVGDGKTWIPPTVGAKLAKRIADRELTRRETQVLHAVAAGKSNKEIGSAFDISEATVKVHMTHILEKLKVTGRTEAINVAVRRGLVRMD
jgi:two-component system, NarL family, response regulator